MTSREARRAFVDYFAARGHRAVPSSPLVLPDDPTLLFANAGMNQFKDVFTGRDRRDYTRAVSVQKCLRVSGKHNDLEMVGRTPRHHTLFEMLGNFSFGDYFKREAVAWAWQLMTEVYGLPVDRLWVTVFGGSTDVEPDDEALALWRDEVGVDPERILRLGEKDNFWRMGDTGPCGPCSEIHFDLGQDLRSTAGPSNPGTDDRRFIEIWNLVFMQFDQRPSGELVRLPAPSVDTGMGLERLAAVLAGRRSNFETDLFLPVIEAAAAAAGVRYGSDPEADFSLRVIADHARALCFLVAEGVVPANDKRGYVLRRLLRRAIRHGRKLGLERPFLDQVTPAVLAGLGEAYPELVAARTAIDEVAAREERRFGETLSAGLVLLEGSLAALGAGPAGARVLDGAELFRLHDTFGFPLDLARDIAAERGVAVDEAGFEAQMRQQRARAQASWKGSAAVEAAGAYAELAARQRTEFRGYDLTRLEDTVVLALLTADGPAGELAAGAEGEVVLDRTPFYAEAGGQVGDRGWLSGPLGRAEVLDTRRPTAGLIAHRVRVEAGRLAAGDRLLAEVDAPRRQDIRRHHTATHLLHAALREVVGLHVKQAGSLVAPDRLRFDFSHFAPLTDAALCDVEALVNREALANRCVESAEMDLDEALRAGAMALFGEKYGSRVRVVRMGDFSLELCGGTHCERTAEVGLFKLTQERGVAAGTRRVEAQVGPAALERFRREHALLRVLEERLAVPQDQLAGEIARRVDELRDLQQELDRRRLEGVRGRLEGAARTPRRAGPVGFVAERADGLSPQELRQVADGLLATLRSGVVVLGRAEGPKASILVAVSPDLVGRIRAGELVRELGRTIGGGGGGRDDMAEAGGKDVARLDEAIAAAPAAIERLAQRAG